ncbi:MAG: prepilin-type N-terminal cleavage/methylation domain-containing protein [Gammaproteobacteria bacterium]|nr:prepilin-type N-terminal cleavage/methylation domain-containing protein [Gammaproteobacteria bacterium]
MLSIGKTIRGLTLIELMVTVAIITILAGIAWPPYNGYISRGHRADAIMLITKVQGYLESCYSQQRNYNTCNSSIPSNITTPVPPNDHFTVAVATSATNPDNFIITATGNTAQQASDDSCITFTLNQAGVKGYTKASSATSTNCWPN